MKKISMQTIADELNISKNSVSQALRDMPGVSHETKAAVKETAKKLGYSYIQNSSKQTGKFLLISTSFVLKHTNFFNELIVSIKNEALQNKYTLDVFEITDSKLDELELPNNIQDYDGIVIVSHSTNAYIKSIAKLGIPTVIVDHTEINVSCDAVLTKNIDGAYAATAYLIENGLNSIGFIGDINFSPNYMERFIGYNRALSDFNLPSKSEQHFTEIEENQQELYKKLNTLKDMPEAWFCVNSGLAFILNTFLQSRGFKVPDDVSIICFDDTDFTRLSKPAITNIATNLNYMGSLTINTLISRITNPDLPLIHHQILPILNELDSVKISNNKNSDS